MDYTQKDGQQSAVPLRSSLSDHNHHAKLKERNSHNTQMLVLLLLPKLPYGPEIGFTFCCDTLAFPTRGTHHRSRQALLSVGGRFLRYLYTAVMYESYLQSGLQYRAGVLSEKLASYQAVSLCLYSSTAVSSGVFQFSLFVVGFQSPLPKITQITLLLCPTPRRP